MTNMKKQARRGFCFFLMCVMLFTSYAFLGTGLSASAVVESVGGSDSLVRTSLAEIKSVLTGLTYGEYLTSHENAAKADTVIDIDIADILTETTDSRGNVVKQTTATVENVSGSDYGTDGSVLLVGDNGKITWNVNIEKSAMYSIVIEYFTGDISVHDADGNVVSQGKSSSIERMLLIDGSVPFKEARSIVLYKSWSDHYLVVDENNKAVLDENGNKQYFTSASEKFQEFVKDQANQNSDSKRLFVTDSPEMSCGRISCSTIAGSKRRWSIPPAITIRRSSSTSRRASTCLRWKPCASRLPLRASSCVRSSSPTRMRLTSKSMLPLRITAAVTKSISKRNIPPQPPTEPYISLTTDPRSSRCRRIPRSSR